MITGRREGLKRCVCVNNAGIPLGTEPVAIVCSPTEYYTPYIYLVTGILSVFEIGLLYDAGAGRDRLPGRGVDRILEKDHTCIL